MCRTLGMTEGYVPWARAAVDSAGAIRAILVAVCVSTVQPLGRFAARSVLFAEPICTDDASGCEALVALLKAHDAYMRRRTLFAEVRPLFVSGREQVALMRCGYERLGYKNYLLYLAVPEEQLWKQVDPRCRGDIRRARRRGDYGYAGVVRIPGIAANSCLVWDSIRRAAARGLRNFDFGGAGWLGETYGQGNFKAKFGGTLVERGRYRRVYAARSLQIAQATYSFIRGFLAPPREPSQWPRSPEYQHVTK